MIKMFTVWLFLLSLDNLASCETKDVRVALLGAGGITNVDSSLALIGARLAVEVINNQSVLPGYRLVPYERVSLVSVNDTTSRDTINKAIRILRGGGGGFKY